MASHTRNSASEEERRQKIRTVGIATIASATAAVVTSQFWIAGTWMAAALTPVLVTLVSELLHKPTEVVARRFTTERDSVLPEAGGAGRPPREPDDVLPDRARTEAPVNVYRSGAPRPRRVRRKVAMGAIAATAAIAFGITAVVLTGTELITGGSIGKGDGKTTLLGGSKNRTTAEEQQSTTPTHGPTAGAADGAPGPADGATSSRRRPRAAQQTTPEGQPQRAPPVPAPQAPPTTTVP